MLLLVAPAEHKVRIEVGYGLEGTLTDALSSVIISSAVVPRFKANDYSGGIERGVDGIISVLSGDTAEWQPRSMSAPMTSRALQRTLPSWCLFWYHLYRLVFFIGNTGGGRPADRYGAAAAPFSYPSAAAPGAVGGGWGGGFGGGFSGGGGSSGGGGASGSW